MAPQLSEERWRRLNAAFDKVIDCPPEERQALIDAETAGDPELRRELEEMLACDSQAARRIAGRIAGLAQLAAMGGEWAGRRVGPYRLIREIGRGGMGIVFEASRDDAEYRKTVALKLAPAWRGQPELLRRFREERQILAGLDHPNIARLLDGGTEDGIPYFVMELVEGVSLTEWLRGAPALRERLGLFQQVCAAVHYAHEGLVVHRDLKPANILVNREGVPKLLDFGIARLLAARPADESVTSGFRPWTPDFASPEQVRGEPITVRSDVYSLGLVLYELLCGERAQAADASSPAALDRSICEYEPPLPSVRAAARGDAALARQLRGDLDTIVAMAIAKDPRRRYGSAAALSADLDRYREGRPVEARPATPLYRLAKLLRRRRVALSAAALVMATAAAGALATVHQARRAERRFEQVRSLAKSFVFDVYDRIQYLPGATEARQAIVSTALRYLQSLRQDAAGDPTLSLELAEAYLRIGDVQGHPHLPSLHDTKGALASYSAARDLLAPLTGKPERRAELGMAQAELKRGLVQYQLGLGKDADDSLQRARAMTRRFTAPGSTDIEALQLAGDISSERALLAADRRDLQRGRRATEETVEIARRLSALQPASLPALDFLAAAQSSLGGLYRSAFDAQNSVRSYRESAATREEMVARQPWNTNYRRLLMISYGHVADALGTPRYSFGMNDLAGASGALAKASAIAEAMAREDPSNRTARLDLANVAFRMGDVFSGQPDRGRDALQAFEKSRRLLEGLLAVDPANEACRYQLLYVERRTGETLEQLGRNAEAARMLAAVMAQAPGFHDTKDARNARFYSLDAGIVLARIKARSGDPSAAALVDHAAEEAIALSPRLPNQRWNEACNYADIGRVFAQLGRNEEAVSWLGRSASVWRALQLPGPVESLRAAQLAAVEADLAKLRR